MARLSYASLRSPTIFVVAGVLSMQHKFSFWRKPRLCLAALAHSPVVTACRVAP